MFYIASKSDYQKAYQNSLADPKDFWAKIAENFSWFEKWQEVSNCNLSQGKIEWFKGGKTNISYNCLDRHLEKNADKVAIIWESNDPKQENQRLTYKELHQKTCQFANLLLAKGVKKGDRVCIYMPMIVEGVVAMLACARIGAIHSVVFAGFSAKSLASRIQDCGAKILITSDLLYRGDKTLELYEIAKEALAECNSIESVILYKRSNKEFSDKKITIWQEEITKYSNENKAEILDSTDPLFILYTSGSTGKPKGILHATGGYMTYAGFSFKNVFQYQENDLFFCTADIGWITGHSYLTYGPLLNGATILMFEGIPTYPTASRFWEIIDKHKVNIFYTAPTAIRSLMQKGDKFVDGFDLSSLKTLGTVGEPINEEAWQWYFEKIGKKKCSIVDTWWQTETGGILISSLAGIVESKPSYAGFPLPGIVPVLFDEEGNEIKESHQVGKLCFKQAWPGMAYDVWHDHEKFLKTYYQDFPGFYLAGDGAYKSADGLYRVIGRIDDVIKVSGHRLGTAEIENAVNSHTLIAESAVVSYPHDIKGEAICVFAILKTSENQDEEKLQKEIVEAIKDQVGAIAKPDKIFIVSDLPKTRSGKIMRRILKKILVNDKDFGDTSTLLNPEIIKVIQDLCN